MQQVVVPDAESVHELTAPEHLLVWAMRAIALGREDCPVVVKTFRRACGANGDQVLQAYAVFARYVALTAQKRLKVHVPGCPCMSADEASMLAVVAAAQSSLHTLDEQALKDQLARLAGRQAEDSLLIVAQSIGQLLEASDLILPDRGGAGDPSPWGEPRLQRVLN